MKPKNTICICFDKNSHEAASFYAATFPDSKVIAIHKSPGDYPGRQGGYESKDRKGTRTVLGCHACFWQMLTNSSSTSSTNSSGALSLNSIARTLQSTWHRIDIDEPAGQFAGFRNFKRKAVGVYKNAPGLTLNRPARILA